MPRVAKISAETWLETAKQSLLEEGLGGVKIDRLAVRLGVTRGGFYHNFKDRDDLLDRLIAVWEKECRFLPAVQPGAGASEAADWIESVVDRLIESDGYDSRFDLAVRDWARADQRASWAVERADRERLRTLAKAFESLGYDTDEASVRARVFYYHQIGYYTIDVKQSMAERRRARDTYLDILCGPGVLAKAHAASRRRRKTRVSA